jgi:hypothetical protein
MSMNILLHALLCQIISIRNAINILMVYGGICPNETDRASLLNYFQMTQYRNGISRLAGLEINQKNISISNTLHLFHDM